MATVARWLFGVITGLYIGSRASTGSLRCSEAVFEVGMRRPWLPRAPRQGNVG